MLNYISNGSNNRLSCQMVPIAKTNTIPTKIDKPICEKHEFDEDVTLLERFSSMNDSRSTTTDILHAEVNYCLNEVENILIAHGKFIEMQSNHLDSNNGLISRCIYLKNLLNDANLTESQLCCDPIFYRGKSNVLLQFNSIEDAEKFVNAHNSKFRVILNSKQDIKNLSIENHVDSNNDESSKSNRVIEKNGFNVDCTSIINRKQFEDKMSNSINAKAKIALIPNQLAPINFYNDCVTKDNNQNVRSLTNDLQPNKEDFETLTIRAKLKQKIDRNRPNHVTLHDVDSIMQNVVKIVQSEFVKRFPPSMDKTRDY